MLLPFEYLKLMTILDEFVDQNGRYRLWYASFDPDLLQDLHKLVFLGV